MDFSLTKLCVITLHMRTCHLTLHLILLEVIPNEFFLSINDYAQEQLP